MVNIYERLLGDSYKRLHPKLQERYAITKENSFIGEGKWMKFMEDLFSLN